MTSGRTSGLRRARRGGTPTGVCGGWRGWSARAGWSARCRCASSSWRSSPTERWRLWCVSAGSGSWTCAARRSGVSRTRTGLSRSCRSRSSPRRPTRWRILVCCGRSAALSNRWSSRHHSRAVTSVCASAGLARSGRGSAPPSQDRCQPIRWWTATRLATPQYCACAAPPDHPGARRRRAWQEAVYGPEVRRSGSVCIRDTERLCLYLGLHTEVFPNKVRQARIDIC